MGLKVLPGFFSRVSRRNPLSENSFSVQSIQNFPLTLGGLLAIAILWLDLILPLGVAAGVPYLFLVLLAWWAPHKKYFYIAALTGTILTFFGLAFSPSGGEMWKVLSNRFLALVVIWGTAFLGVVYKSQTEELEETNDKFKEEIIERQRASHALEESELRFRQLAENIEEVFWIVSPDFSQMIYISPGFEKIWGKSIQSVYERPESWFDPIHPEDRDRARSLLTSREPLKSKLELEYRIVQPDGSIRWVRSLSFPVQSPEGETYRIAGIAEDITEAKRVEENLKMSENQLRELCAHLESVREEERFRVAREIHDELGQVLTTLKLEISLLGETLPKDSEQVRENLPSLLSHADSAIQTVKKISGELRPFILDNLGLLDAIEWEVGKFEKRTGIQCETHLDCDDRHLELDRAITIFRIFQETLTNIVRHADATRMSLTIKEENGCIKMAIVDNGNGISERDITAKDAFGLIGMRERAYAWGGETSIRGTAGKGTEVVVHIPLENNQTEENPIGDKISNPSKAG